MSDHDNAPGDVLELLDRAAAHTPPLHLDRRDVVARGEQIVRRRRAGGAGMTIGALALAGAAWLGAGVGGGGLLGTQDVSPAAVTWEVEEPSTVVLPEGLESVGNVQPRTLSRTATSSLATFVADGVEETVEGRTLPGGVEVYVGARATVAVWDHPRGASPNTVVRPESRGTGGAAMVTVDGQELMYWTTDEAGYVPEEVIFHDEDSLWTADGEVAETAELNAEAVGLTAVSAEDVGLVGYLDQGSFYEVDTLTVSSVDLPWWRGGGHVVTTVARLPREAVFAREILREEPAGDPVRVSAPRPTTLVGPWSMVLFASDWAGGGPQSNDKFYEIQWSTDGTTWHDQPHDLAPAPSDPPVGTVAPGGQVTLLAEPYRVATDRHGWPRLVDEDGTTFLTVTDELGPAAGGMIDMDGGFWPWRADASIHFYVGWQPPAGGEVVVRGEDGEWIKPQDVVSVSGPEGVVTLVSVPAGVARDTGGLGLRTDDAVTPISP